MTRSSSENRLTAGRDLFKDMKKKKSKDVPKDKPAPVMVGEHGRYQIKSGRLSGEFVARAFPKPPTTARGVIAEATGATEEAAIAALHEVIDARESRRTDERRKDARTGMAVPSTEEYVEAIRQVALSGPQRAMLLALSLAGEEGLQSARIARAAGYKSFASANRSLAGAGLLIADYLSVDTVPREAPGDPEGAALLAFHGETQDDAPPETWILHAELREAVRLVM